MYVRDIQREPSLCNLSKKANNFLPHNEPQKNEGEISGFWTISFIQKNPQMKDYNYFCYNMLINMKD